MSATRDILNHVFSALGDYAPTARTFVIDMHDAQDVDVWNEVIALNRSDASDMAVFAAVTETFVSQGYVIDSVGEVLDGYTYAELSVIAETDIKEATKHMRTIYINHDYIPEVIKKYPSHVEQIKKEGRFKP